MSDAERLQAIRLADSVNGRTARVSVKYEKDRDELEAENAKLRELCTALYKCRDKVSECGTCEDVACPLMDDCRLHDRMRKLGVDV